MSVSEVTRQNIKETIDINQIVIFDFWAEWCAPCKRFAPIFEAVAAKHKDIKFVKVNTDSEQELAATFEIRSIPTIAVIKEQDIILMQPGSVSEDILEQIIKKAREVDMKKVRAENS
jgi:thioredoxin 1